MKNTLENKNRFFAQYWGQHLIIMGSFLRIIDHVTLCNIENDDILQLKPLSKISDEDAFEIGCLINCWTKWERKEDWFRDDKMKETHILSGRGFAKACDKSFGAGMTHPFHDNNSTDILTAYDYLRSKGYALPYMDLSVEDLIDYGWIKLEE